MNNLCLKIVSIAYCIFGLLWFMIPRKLLSLNTKMIQYDSIHVHMTRIYGLTLILASGFGIYSFIKKENSLIMFTLISYILYSILVIIYQFKANNTKNSQWDKIKHTTFGSLGMILVIIICMLGLFLE